MEQVQFDTLMAVIQNFGMWGIFGWLYLLERKAHEETRKLWIDDLRDIAFLKRSLREENGRPPTEGKKPSYPIET